MAAISVVTPPPTAALAVNRSLENAINYFCSEGRGCGAREQLQELTDFLPKTCAMSVADNDLELYLCIEMWAQFPAGYLAVNT